MLEIRDVMTRHVHTVTPETTMREAAELFARHHISGAPVVAGHRVVGVVSAADLLAFVAANDNRGPAGEERVDEGSEERSLEEFEDEATSLYFRERTQELDSDDTEPFIMDDTKPADLFSDHTVGEVMTRRICSLPPDAKVAEAARYMWQAGIHRVLVLEGEHLAGIVSMSDLAAVLSTEI